MSKKSIGGRVQSKSGSIRLEFDPSAQVTAFGGLALTEKLARRAGLWGALDRLMPTRRGYDWTTVVKSLAVGLMTGPRGTFAAEDVRRDPVLQRLVGLASSGVPEEATVWRALGELSRDGEALAVLERETRAAARRLLAGVRMEQLGPEGFVSVFPDGSLLEGSPRREGTKVVEDKGRGLLWTVCFVGPVPVASRLCAPGEGEATAARALLEKTKVEVLEPAGLLGRALVLADSLHGNGGSLDVVEDLGLRYVVGARGLSRAAQVLDEQPESRWVATPSFDKRRGAEGSRVCVASLHCEGWSHARTLVARRWNMPGDLFPHEIAVLTNLTEDHPQLRALMEKRKLGFAEAILWLYDRKGACETYFKGMLADLGLHHPPCQQWGHNAAFYAIGALTGMLSAVTALMKASATGGAVPTIATVRRQLWAVPAWIGRHARSTVARVMGLDGGWRRDIELAWLRIARC